MTSLVPSARVIQSIASTTVGTSENTVKPCKILNKNILVNGSFDKMLIISDKFTHLLALTRSKYSKCQRHEWVQKRTRKQIAYCADCNVCICSKCYKTFHTVLGLQRVKKGIQNDCEYCIMASKSEESPLSEM